MNQSFSFSVLNKDQERRRALAKIYALLVKLADEAENRATPPVIESEEEKVTEPTSVPLK